MERPGFSLLTCRLCARLHARILSESQPCSELTVCAAPMGRGKVSAQVILLRVGLATLSLCILMSEQVTWAGLGARSASLSNRCVSGGELTTPRSPTQQNLPPGMCLQRRPMPGEVATWWGRQAAPASVAASGEGMSPQPANNSYVGHRAATANGVHPGTQAGGESAQPVSNGMWDHKHDIIRAVKGT